MHMNKVATAGAVAVLVATVGAVAISASSSSPAPFGYCTKQPAEGHGCRRVHADGHTSPFPETLAIHADAGFGRCAEPFPCETPAAEYDLALKR
jgi:hypothetical protein